MPARGIQVLLRRANIGKALKDCKICSMWQRVPAKQVAKSVHAARFNERVWLDLISITVFCEGVPRDCTGLHMLDEATYLTLLPLLVGRTYAAIKQGIWKWAEPWGFPEGFIADEPLVGQVMAVEEPGVQGIAGGRAVGRAGGIRRGQGEHLPDADVMVGQQLEPSATGLSEASTNGAARQGGGMQQHSGTAPRSSLGRVNSGLIHGGLFVSQGWLLQKSAASPRSCPAMPSRATRSKNCSSVSVP